MNFLQSLFAITAAKVEEVFGEDSNELLHLEHGYEFSTSKLQDTMRE